MAVFAGIPRGDSSMLLLGCLGAFHYKGNHHFVLLYQGHGMADLTLKIPVFAGLPGLKGILHKVARHTEFGVFLCMAVIPEAKNTADNGYKEEQGHDSLPVLFNELAK